MLIQVINTYGLILHIIHIQTKVDRHIDIDVHSKKNSNMYVIEKNRWITYP